MADFAGRLNIALHRNGDGLRATIESSRPVSASRVFVGKTVEETVARLPTLFSICVTAQASACVTACEAALGVVPGPGVAELRRLLVDAETVKEHLWRILLDWPRFLGEAPDAPAMASVMRRHAALGTALSGGRILSFGARAAEVDLPEVRRAVHELAGVSADRVFGAPPAEWLAATERSADLMAWSRRTPSAAAHLLRLVEEAGWASAGSSSVDALPVLSVAQLEDLVGGDDAARFVAAPLWDGRPAETSPYTRNRGHTLVAALAAEFGSGLLSRLGAQLVELARVLAGLPGRFGDLGGRDKAAEGPAAPGIGLAQVPAARGLLVHRVVLDDRCVADYRILAPTEWNFHPEGVVARGLAGLSATDVERLRRQAGLFVTAVDPCVHYDVSIH
jgi:coenzyme F420-reducing hydrogenase alpha subunit